MDSLFFFEVLYPFWLYWQIKKEVLFLKYIMKIIKAFLLVFFLKKESLVIPKSETLPHSAAGDELQSLAIQYSR